MEHKDEEFKVVSAKADCYDEVEVNVTGFGKFGPIKENPTTTIVGALEKILAANPIPKLRLGVSKVVTVSAVDSLQAVNELVEVAAKKTKENPKVKQVIIHFGVAAKNKIFYVETKGYNGADFANYPDERGYKADGEAIIKGIAYNHPLESIMPCSDLVFSMQGTGLPVDVSDNPGSYVCNYIYYTSLYKTLPLRIPAMFVHVPTFEAIKQEDQFNFVHALLTAIRDLYTES